jgi:hypothetical protein
MPADSTETEVLSESLVPATSMDMADPAGLKPAPVPGSCPPFLLTDQPVLVTRRKTRVRAVAPDVPLFMVPHLVRWRVREFGQRLYRVSVARTHWHHYTVKVRSRRKDCVSFGRGRQACVDRYQTTLPLCEERSTEAGEDE